MRLSDYPDYAHGVAYALELILNEVMGADEVEMAMQEITDQWSDTPAHALSIWKDWQQVMRDEDYELARYLVREWARQGDMPPVEAYLELQKWYDRLLPFWLKLSQ